MPSIRQPSPRVWKSIRNFNVLLSFCGTLGAGGPVLRAGMTDLAGPPGTYQFGGDVKVLSNGNYVVVDQYYQPPGRDVQTGGVFLYSRDGALISTLTGSSADDRVGSGGITVLANGNFVIVSYRWDNGKAVDAGAVTWGSMTTGVSGEVSPDNSLVGTTYDDQIGDSSQTRGLGGVVALSNGNYVVCSPTWTWQNGAPPLRNAGAVTWGDGTKGVRGVISDANSLVGTAAGMAVGQKLNGGGVTEVGEGNYVLSTPYWKSGGLGGLGAVTWCDGKTGRTGAITSQNSLVGTQEGDWVGGGRIQGRSITVLASGDYVVSSPNWSRGAVKNAGAVTWCPGSAGRAGAVTEENSLVGVTEGDKISNYDNAFRDVEGVVALKNGNYVVSSFRWDKGAIVDAGAATWCRSDGATTGPVTEANSVTGSKAGDAIGRTAALTSGNYVVAGELWDNGSALDAGGVRLMDGTMPSSGVLSAENSLTGTQANDLVSSGGVVPLANGNFVAASPKWKKGALGGAGAVTWVNGNTGLTGPVTEANSLTGAGAGDYIGGSLNITTYAAGGRVTALVNGHYVVSSPYWKGRRGAVTWCDGAAGRIGTVTEENSIIGNTGDFAGGGFDTRLGGVTPLPDGNYVIGSPMWKTNGFQAGAVTWASGAAATSLVISAANSLTGTVREQYLGQYKAIPLAEGAYVLRNPEWTSESGLIKGALFYSAGTAPPTGIISESNSVVGTGNSSSFSWDGAGKRLLVGVPGGNRVTVLSAETANVPQLKLVQENGAGVTAGSTVAMAGETAPGSVKALNLIFGNTGYASLRITSVTVSDAQFALLLPAEGVSVPRQGTVSIPLVFTPVQAGVSTAVVRILTNDPSVPEFSFTVTATSAVAPDILATDRVGPPGSERFGWEVALLPNGNLVVTDPWYDAPGPVKDAGAVYLFSRTGTLLSTLTGSSEGDMVGDGGVVVLTNGHYVIRSGSWSHQGAFRAGAVTWGNAATGVSGTVSAANSLVGSREKDDVGGCATFGGGPGVIPLPNGNYLVLSPVWNMSFGVSSVTGAVTLGRGEGGVSGVVGAFNSLIGYLVGDGGIEILSNGNGVVRSSAGVTWISADMGINGQISSSNSLFCPGEIAGGVPVVQGLKDGNYVAAWPDFDGGRGAVVWGNGTVGSAGTVQDGTALTGGDSTDRLGSGGLAALPEGGYAVLSPQWSQNRGAVTWGQAGTAISGKISAANSLIGGQPGDLAGQGGLTLLANGNAVVSSPAWADGAAVNAGAVTWIGSGSGGPATGPVSAANSLTGSHAGDQVGVAGITALADGHYTVASPQWNQRQGAVTWGDGLTGRTGPVTEANSLTGLSPQQGLGLSRVVALGSGAYVINCPYWRNATGDEAGAVMWMRGSTDGAGVFNQANALTGFSHQDYVGSGGVQPLANGHFVIVSPSWSANRGAVTWADGFKPLSGTVSAANSLTGGTSGDFVGAGDFSYPGGVTVLANGNYTVVSPNWTNKATVAKTGAVTLAGGTQGIIGEVSAANSLIGSVAANIQGMPPVITWGDGAWATSIVSRSPGSQGINAMILGTGRTGGAMSGAVDFRNSVMTESPISRYRKTLDYYPDLKLWAVGRPGYNRVILCSYTVPARGRISVEQLPGALPPPGAAEPTGWDLPNGSTVDFGIVDAGQPVDRTVLIRNTGGTGLGGGVMMLNGRDFFILEAPAQITVPQGKWSYMVLRFFPSSPGFKSGAVRIVSNDPEQPEITLNLQGTARPYAAWPFGQEGIAPEIMVLPDGEASVRFQAVAGITYILQRSQDLVTWDFSGHVTADETGAVRFTDSSPPEKGAFYRLKAR
ncbi:MAG: Cadherin proteinputative collagen-binding protein [Verrucomicrobiales bacterium]|nr:Cadherin proteinputative collagen-binding protein [Verrucomicrobiales bacterium]